MDQNFFFCILFSEPITSSCSSGVKEKNPPGKNESYCKFIGFVSYTVAVRRRLDWT